MFSVGEASGDLHGANVASAIKLLSPDAHLFGMGGEKMRDAGVDVVYDIKDLGVIGVVEVIKNLRRLFKLRDMLASLMDSEKPDVFVVIDYPGFNTRLSKIAKKKGIPIVSYISPSAWAWGKGRAKEVAETVNKVAAIFPFEAQIYEAAGADVTFVGHPLLDIVKPTMTKEESRAHFAADKNAPLVLIMPGSRQQEIDNHLQPMLLACRKIKEQIPLCQFYLPVASTISREIIEEKMRECQISVRIATDNIYDLMNIADTAIVASGTAALEISLMRVPNVIIYKVAAITYYIGKMVVKIPHIGLPNIIAGRKIMPEILQYEINGDIIAKETLAFLTDDTVRRKALAALDEVREKLGQTGAVKRVAELILDVASTNKKT
jgi:lipid-A-disaccharide synthase